MSKPALNLRWWTRLALISAIAGFVLSGPPSGFESPAALLNDVAAPTLAPMTIDTTEPVSSEIVSEIKDDAVEAPDMSATQTADLDAATAP